MSKAIRSISAAVALAAVLTALIVPLNLPLSPVSPAGAATPAPFLWGVATSSYQVEGGIDCRATGFPCNDYDFFNGNAQIRARVAANTGQIGASLDIQPAGAADGFWIDTVYKRDFDYAQMLGLNAMRVSLEWGRIEPQEDVWDAAAIQQYVTMIDEMRERGIQPVVSLNHFTLPRWILEPPDDSICIQIPFTTTCATNTPIIQNPDPSDPGYQASKKGFETQATVDEFREFVQKIVPILKGKVDVWLTVNEPVGSMVSVGYIGGAWSPGFVFDGPRAKAALHNLIQAHVDAYDVVTALDNVDADGDGVNKQVGFAHAMGETVASPGNLAPGSGAANQAAAANFDYFLSDYMVNAVTRGVEDTTYVNSATSVKDEFPSATCASLAAQSSSCIHPEWQNRIDFLGINHYRRFHVYNSPVISAAGVGFLGGVIDNDLAGKFEPHELLNDLGFAVHPEGLYGLMKRAQTKWNLPVLITENGTAERQDRNRAGHLLANVRQVARAINDGVSVLGYLHWTLMDNWELQHHYKPKAKFGLFGVERTNPQARSMTEAAMAYQQVVDESRALTPASGSPTAGAVDNAAEKFGELTADGMRYVPPSRTHGRLWSGGTDQGRVTLYLGFVKANQRVTGMIYRHSLGHLPTSAWRRVDLFVDANGPFLREYTHNDSTGASVSRDIRASYANGSFTLLGNPSGTLDRIPGTGLWSWGTTTSPWGTANFYVSNFEGSYRGKYLTFSNPGPNDVANPACLPGFCLPQVSGNTWRSFAGVGFDTNASQLRLDGRGKDYSGNPAEDLFDVVLAINGSTPNAATTVAGPGGTFKAAKVLKPQGPFDVPFGWTGYVAPFSDVAWTGERDGSTISKFHFLEGRALWRESPTNPAPVDGVADQYLKEQEPVMVLPVVGFNPQNGIRWEAGGRFYAITSFPDPSICIAQACTGTWSDIGGRTASRVSERFPVVAGQLVGQTLEATSPGGVNTTLTAPPAFHLDGAVTFTWTGPFATLPTGPNPTVFLPIGSHEICVKIQVGFTALATRCATFVVRDTTPPVITCAAPDGAWHATDVTIPCTASDVGAGLANAADASFSLTTTVAAGTETAVAATGTRAVCDGAGNCATAGPVAPNKVDKKPPSITFATPSDGAAYVLDSVQVVSFSCTDGGSGVASCTGTLPVGSLLPTASLGTRTFSVSAADNVANAASQTVGYAITYGVCPLYDQARPVGVAGSTVPVRLRLCNASGTNLSSSSITVTATTLDGSPPPPNFSGGSNLGNVFRYDSTISGYVYNVNTRGLTPGSHTMGFKVSGDTVEHTVAFVLR